MVLRVRELTVEEGQKLQRALRHGQNAIAFKRAQIVLASAQGFTPPKISVIALMSEDYIRDVIHAFNEHGMAMLQPKWGPGRPPKFTDDQRKALVDLALSRPKDLGLPYAQWSLSRLREQAVQRGIVESISEEWLRVILHEDDVSHQSIRTWKTSPDPLFEEKKRKVDQLTRKRHNPPIVLSMDEIGPIQLIPHGGEGWFPERVPGRIPAEYEKKFGTAYYFLTLNVFHQKLHGRAYRTKHAANWLDYLKDVRPEYPSDEWVNLVWDGASTHWTAEIRAWAKANKVRLFATPTHASHLNPVECHAGDLQKLALPGQTFTSLESLGQALDAAVAYRNEERKARGKQFRDTVRKDHRKRAKMPIWLRPR
ncbi:MAG: IS630 family transposase [Thermoplasmata archaeon]